MARKPKSIIQENMDESISNIEVISSYGSYSLPSAEQETVINFSRVEDFATVSTSDSTMKTKLDKLCEESPEYYSLIEENNYYKTYRIEDKTLVSFRKKKKEMSEEMRDAASARFKKLHEEGKIGRKRKSE